MKVKSLIFFAVISLAVTLRGNSQCLSVNLIKNPSLEEYDTCPWAHGQIFFADYWTQPLPYGWITSDYYNTCYFEMDSLYDSTIALFFQYSFFGNGYAGIILTENNPGTTEYREYIQGELSETLEPGWCYYCEFWVRPFNVSPMATSFSAIDDISIYFSDTLPYKSEIITTHDMPFYFTAQLENPTGNVITDTNNWTKISGSFTANGGEKYLTVGAFKQQSDINVIFFNTFSPNYSYYFFDNFSLCPCEDTILPQEPEPVVYIPNIFSPNGDGQNDVFRVRGENIETLHLTVYNRWGEKVFQSQNNNDGWDGNYKGKPCADGVYLLYSGNRVCGRQAGDEEGECDACKIKDKSRKIKVESKKALL